MNGRIVSLLPSATEIVCALGARDRLVGRSHECDFPSGTEVLPVLTEPKVCVDGDSETIHHSVSSILAREVSVYNVHAALLRELRPDVIVTQIQCDVCAVSLRDVEAAVAEMAGVSARIVALNPVGIDAVWADIARVGEAIGRNPDALIRSLRDRIDRIAARTQTVPPKTVAAIEWISPLMYAGTWMPELIEFAGGVSVGLDADPDVILILPCGFSIARSEKDLHFLTARPEWSALRAVRNGEVYIVDGNQYCNRPGPRLVESVEIVAEILNPDLFHFGHDDIGWIRAQRSERIYNTTR